MGSIWDQLLDSVKTYAPSLIGAILILIIGWFVAKLIAGAVRRGLGRTKLGGRVTRWIGGEGTQAAEAERRVAKVVYYLIMLLVLVAFFQVLGLTIATEPLNKLLNTVFEFIPKIVGAAILILIAWIIASVLRLVIVKLLSGAQIDERFGKKAGAEEEKQVPLSKMIGDVVYWLVFLLFLPAILSALKLDGLLTPVQTMTEKLLGFVPNLLAAALILIIGWFVARLVRIIVTNLLAVAGADSLSERIGLAQLLGDKKLSGFLGLLIYILILFPVLVAALNALQLDAITQPTSNMLNVILEAIPSIFAAAIIVIVACLVGRVVKGLIASLLAGAGFNSIMERLGLGKAEEGKRTASEIVGYLVMVAIILVAVTAAFNLLEFTILNDLMGEFLVFAGHVIVGLIIFGFGLYLANLISRTLLASGKPQAGLMAVLAKIAIMVLVSAIALRQMGFANQIVNLAFGLLLGAVALAAAIAFGVGGRDFASRRLEEWQKSLKPKE